MDITKRACDTCVNCRAKLKVNAIVNSLPSWYEGNNVYIDHDGNKLLVSSTPINYSLAEMWCSENMHSWKSRGLFTNSQPQNIRRNCRMWKEG